MDAVSSETIEFAVELPEPTLYEQHPYLNRPWGDGFNNEKPRVYTPETPEPIADNNPHTPGWMFALEPAPEPVPEPEPVVEVMDRPGDYVAPPIPVTNVEAAAHPGGRYAPKPAADNAPVDLGKAASSDFGNQFPAAPEKGDVYLRTDFLPNRLFKYNGNKWIEVDKEATDVYAYEEQYIQHLIEEIAAGRYDTDTLTAVEREQIQQYLSKNAQ